jgi:hypothetical protein
LGLVLSLIATFYAEARRRSRPPVRTEEPAQPVTAPEPTAAESLVDQTMALRPPPAWSRSTENRSAAEPGTGRSVMTVAPAAEPLDEESTHGQRSHTGQRDR